MIKNKKGSSILSFKTYQKNNKTISILLSSNSKLYGDIGRKVFQYFLKSIQDKNTDIYIVGRVGKEFFDATGVKTPYKYVDFPEGKDEKENLNKILPILTEYENVNIFYGQYVNVLTQNPALSDVLGEEEIEENQKSDDKTHFFFEPSLEKVYKLFQDEISGSIFRQTVHESELSHVASRITQMESALGNILTSQKNLNNEKRRLTKREEGKKQLERLAGMKVWK
jgi:F0F1-type ATP synthase gamma subunit